MKKINLLLLFLVILVFASQAQIIEIEKVMSLGTRPGLEIEMPGVEYKIAKNEWNDFIDEYDGKTRRNRREQEYFTDEAHIVGIGGANTIDVYARIEKIANGSRVTVWFDLGALFLNREDHPGEFEEAKRFLQRYTTIARSEQLEKTLEEEEDRLDDLEDDLKDLKEDKKEYEEDIADARKEIAKKEKDIEENLKKQEEVGEALELQRQQVEKARERLANLKNDQD